MTVVDAAGAARRRSWAELAAEAATVAAGFADLAPGTAVVLQLPDLADHLAAFWGALLAGLQPLTVALPARFEADEGVVRKLVAARARLGGAPVVAGGAAAAGWARLGVPTRPLVRGPAAGTLPPPGDVAFLQLSSGSTGASKIIPIRHAGVFEHVAAAGEQLGYRDDERFLSWLPLDHVVPTLTFHLAAVVLGADLVLVEPAYVLADVLRWPALLEAHGATRTWAPHFAFALLADRVTVGQRWSLAGVRTFLDAGELVTAPVLRRFLAALAPSGVAPSAVVPAFGMAELCTTMTHHTGFSLDRVLRLDRASQGGELRPGPGLEWVDCGPPTRGVELRIVDPAAPGRVLPERWVGRLQVRGGPIVTPGYVDDPAANEDAFVGGGWFDTGDLGALWDGRLVVTGRRKEILLLRGVNLHCQEVEEVVGDDPAVEPSCVAAVGIPTDAGTEALAVVFVARGPVDDRVRRRLAREVARRLGVRPTWVVDVPLADFPRTTSGKLQRAALRDRLIASPPPPLGSGNQAASPEGGRLGAVLEILRTALPDVGPDDVLLDAGADSLSLLQLSGRLLDALGVQVPPGLLAEATARTVADAPGGARPPPEQTEGPAPYAASWLVLAGRSPGTHLRNLVARLRVEGPGARDAAVAAIRALPARHAALHTTLSGWWPRARSVPVPAGWGPTLRDAGDGAAAARALRDRPLPLDRAPLLAAELLVHGPHDVEVLLAVPHPAADPEGLRAVVDDLLALLRDPAAPPPAAVPSPAALGRAQRDAASDVMADPWVGLGRRIGDPRLQLPDDATTRRAAPFDLPRVPIEPAVVDRLALRCRARGHSVGTGLLAAWLAALHGFAPHHHRVTSLVLRSTRDRPGAGVHLDCDVVSVEPAATPFPDLVAQVGRQLADAARHPAPEVVKLAALTPGGHGRRRHLLRAVGRGLAPLAGEHPLVLAGALALATAPSRGLLPLFDLYPTFLRPDPPLAAAWRWTVTWLPPSPTSFRALSHLENDGTLELVCTRDDGGAPELVLQSPLRDDVAHRLLSGVLERVEWASRAG